MANQEAKTQEVGSVFDLLGKSFDIVKLNWQTFLFVNILTILAAFSTLAPMASHKDISTLESGLSGLSGLELGLVASLGTIFVLGFIIINAYFFVMQQILSTRASKGEKPTVGQLFNEANKRLFRIILLFLLSSLIILGGLLLLIVPGIIAIGRIAMSPYIMIDKNLGVLDSIKESNRTSKKYTWKVWAAILVLFFVGILGAIVGAIPYIGQIIGTIVTISFSLVLGLRYFQLKKLDSSSETSQGATAPPPPIETPHANPVIS